MQIVFLQGKRKGMYKDVHDRRALLLLNNLARAKTTLLAATPEAGFSQYPTGIARFRLGSAALVHENLAPLRFSVSLRIHIFNNHSRKGNHTFPLRNSIWQSLASRKG
ncbi:MAG TPA: hypothetical protein H9731_02175 [Candidatus Borkfalkia excrementipullorum]|nr:hypothetical protein [Candidatus Borkfalkia excrementipullorum]